MASSSLYQQLSWKPENGTGYTGIVDRPICIKKTYVNIKLLRTGINLCTPKIIKRAAKVDYDIRLTHEESDGIEVYLSFLVLNLWTKSYGVTI